jgi:hypothetical protein
MMKEVYEKDRKKDGKKDVGRCLTSFPLQEQELLKYDHLAPNEIGRLPPMNT